MERRKLTGDELQSRVSEIDGWSIKEDKLTKTFSFKTYAHGVLFAVALANEADKLDHHPDLTIGYQKVTVAVNTHDVGGISDWDFALAAKADEVAK